jgi:hypothetical protein
MHMSIKQTTEDFVAKAREKHGDFYDYTKSVYSGGLNFLCITCPVHGDFMQKASDHSNTGKGCKLCGNARGAPSTLTTEEFVTRASKIHEDKYDYTLTTYTNSKTPVSISCPEHGPFSQEAGRHLRGSGCPLCRCNRSVKHEPRKPAEERKEAWLKQAYEKHGDFYDYTKVDFINTKADVTITCPEHGDFSQTPINHSFGGCGCPSCGRQKVSSHKTKAHAEWLKDFRRVHGDKYGYTKTRKIKSARDKITIYCPEHGPFEQAAYCHHNGNGCPTCGISTIAISKPEDEIHAWLQQILPDTTTILRSERKTIAPYELDLYIPDHKLAIEFNGTYWHMDTVKPKDYHQKKSLMCRKQGITLIHVYEHDWEEKKDKYKNIIQSKAGTLQRKYDARKLQIREVPHYRDFLLENHFQGHVGSCKQYGLFDGDTLVALMTFGQSRFKAAHTWELLRFCCLAGTQVRGGASRLFRHFTRTCLQPQDTIISYARLDYSTGYIYEKLGFSFDEVCDPDYVWIPKASGKTLRRQSTQKHKLKRLLGKKYDATLSEAGNMRAAGYRRIYTAGNLRYIYVHGDT